jgi:predicted O-methyltransferase YrrM
MSHLLQVEYVARKSAGSDIQQHLPTLYETVQKYPQVIALELGVRWGTSTAALLAGVDEVDGHLWSVDIAQPTYPQWWHETGRWTLTIGSDTDREVMAAQPAELDVLFIDTVHTYEHTLAELRAWVPRVKPGGVVLMHDTELDGALLTRLWGPQPAHPVAEALDTYCGETGLTWTNTTGCYGLGTIHIGTQEGGRNAP